MNGVHFPTGNTFVIVVDTNKYSGNFDQEMVAYLIGADTPRGSTEFFAEDAEQNPKLADLKDINIHVDHSEYGEVYSTIWETPGYVNDGCGRLCTVEEFQANHPVEKHRSFPAYQSVAFFFCQEVKPEEIQLLRERCDSFIEYYNEPDLKILAIRQLKINMKRAVQTVVSEI